MPSCRRSSSRRTWRTCVLKTSGSSTRRRIALAAALLLAAPRASRAQEELAAPPLPPSPASVAGRVVMPGREHEIPVAGVMVTVHRVGPDSAGPLDSVRTDASGRFSVRFQRFGSEEAVYFAAAVYHGIAYFSSPLRGAVTRGDDAEITVFDTTSRTVPFTVQGHHIVVGAPQPDGRRDIVEVYELSNDTTVTVVARDSLSPLWSAPIPKGATRFAGGQGDVSPGALAMRDGRVVLLSPFGPGVKQLSYSYSLGEGAFPLRFALEHQTGVLEVLLEERGAQARGPSLRSQDTVTTQGRTFKRFLAQGALQGEELRIDVPTAAAGTRTRVLAGLAVVIALAMAAALVRALTRRGAVTASHAPAAEPARAEALAAAIAALDARHEAADATLDASRYASERAALKAQLAAALAAGDTPG